MEQNKYILLEKVMSWIVKKNRLKPGLPTALRYGMNVSVARLGNNKRMWSYISTPSWKYFTREIWCKWEILKQWRTHFLGNRTSIPHTHLHKSGPVAESPCFPLLFFCLIICFINLLMIYPSCLGRMRNVLCGWCKDFWSIWGDLEICYWLGRRIV